MYAALPWLQRAEAVRILSAEGYQRRGPAAPDLAAYLALHGVHADIVMFQSVDKSVGAGLLAAARDFGCDLLAMGAYSHSRLRQLILGGVTRHVLENASAAGDDEPLRAWTDAARTAAALDAYVKLLRAGRSVLARVEPRLAAAGLTPTQFGVLEAVLHKGPLSSASWAERC